MNETNGDASPNGYSAKDSVLGGNGTGTVDHCFQTAAVVTGEVLPVEIRHQFEVLYDDTPRDSDDNRLPPGIV